MKTFVLIEIRHNKKDLTRARQRLAIIKLFARCANTWFFKQLWRGGRSPSRALATFKCFLCVRCSQHEPYHPAKTKVKVGFMSVVGIVFCLFHVLTFCIFVCGLLQALVQWEWLVRYLFIIYLFIICLFIICLFVVCCRQWSSGNEW